MTSTTVLPSTDDPVVAAAVEAIGGRPGRHARIGERRLASPTAFLILLTLLTSLLGFLQKAPCRDGSTWVHEHQYTRACYTDVVALYSAEGLSNGEAPYYDHPVEYPVVIGGVMQLSAVLARGLDTVAPDAAESRAVDAVRKAQVAAAASTDDKAATARLTAAIGARDYKRAVARGRHFYDVTWLLVTICALIVTVTTCRLAGRRPWDAALFALSPALLVHATTNWDLVAVALAGLAMLAWARRNPALAGVLLGLATATKLYPVLFLIPLLLLCFRARQVRAWALTALLTVLVAVGVTAPVYLTAPSYAEVSGTQVKVLSSPWSNLGKDGISALAPHHTVNGVKATNATYRFIDLNKERGADWDSLYLQVQHLHTDKGALKGARNGLADLVTDAGVPPTKLNRGVAILEVLGMLLLSGLVLLAPRRPRLPQVLFLTTVVFLLLNKVDSPQYVLWLVPLAALSHPRWRPFLAWQAAEIAVLASRFYFFVGNDKPGQGIAIGWFFAMVLLRDLLLLVFAGHVVRDIVRPDRDVVRRDGVDDPAGGVLDGAPDR
ncbi:MAG: putative transrane protein, partial [Frankiales bacterium]|nr:putative transrane protein [Frankiales bacterium]